MEPCGLLYGIFGLLTVVVLDIEVRVIVGDGVVQEANEEEEEALVVCFHLVPVVAGAVSLCPAGISTLKCGARGYKYTSIDLLVGPQVEG